MVALEYAGHTLIGFDDSSYRWISVKKFVWPGAGDNSDVLAALIVGEDSLPSNVRLPWNG